MTEVKAPLLRKVKIVWFARCKITEDSKETGRTTNLECIHIFTYIKCISYTCKLYITIKGSVYEKLSRANQTRIFSYITITLAWTVNLIARATKCNQRLDLLLFCVAALPDVKHVLFSPANIVTLNWKSYGMGYQNSGTLWFEAPWAAV